MSDKIPSWNIVHKLEKRQLLIAINCVAALSILFFGYDQGMMSGVNNAKNYIDLMGFGYTKEVNGELTPVVTNSLLQGGIVSVYYLGTLFGAFFGGWLGDRMGRIKSIAAGALWAVVGASLQCSAQNHNWMICGKWKAYAVGGRETIENLEADDYSSLYQRHRYWYTQCNRACVGY